MSYDNATVQLLEEALMESDQQVVKTAKLVVFVTVMESAYTEITWVLEKLLNLEYRNLQQLGSCSKVCWVFLGLEQQWLFLEFWNWRMSEIWRWSALEFWAQGSF